MTPFSEVIKQTQYYYKLLKMMRKYNFPHYSRIILDIEEKMPGSLKAMVKTAEFTFSDN